MFALAREVLVPSFLRRQESRRSVGVKGAPNVRAGSGGAGSVIPAEAGIQAICGGQGRSQCSRWLGRCWFRHSCGGRNPGDLWGSRALPMFALAREVLVPSFLRRQESRRPVGVKGAPNVRRRPIMRGALGALVGRRADGRSSHRWAVAWIPAYAGMTDRAPTAPTELIFNTVALSLRDISPRVRGESHSELP